MAEANQTTTYKIAVGVAAAEDQSFGVVRPVRVHVYTTGSGVALKFHATSDATADDCPVQVNEDNIFEVAARRISLYNGGGSPATVFVTIEH